MNDPASTSMEPEGSIANLLWQFDRELAGGMSPDWSNYLEQCSDEALRIELLREMIRCEQGQSGWDLGRIKDRLRLYARFDPSASGASTLLRGIYLDRLEQGERPHVSEFEALGYSA